MPKIHHKQDAFRGDSSHLAIRLKSLDQETSTVWNNWPMKSQETPDLMGVNLSGANLTRVTMLHASAYGGQFRKANLTNRPGFIGYI